MYVSNYPDWIYRTPKVAQKRILCFNFVQVYDIEYNRVAYRRIFLRQTKEPVDAFILASTLRMQRQKKLDLDDYWALPDPEH